MLISINIPKDSKYLLFFMFLNFCLDYIQKEYTQLYLNNYHFLHSLSLLFLFFFYLWEKILSKKDNKKEKSTINNNYLIKRIILIISYLMFYMIYNYIFNLRNNEFFVIEHFNTLFFLFVLIELIFFKKYIYSHHIISIIITFIIVIYYRCINDFKFTYLYFILQCYCNCFCFLLIKYISTKYFINIYLLGSLIGIPGLIQFYKTSFFKEIKENILFYVLLFILFVFHNFIYCVVIFKIGVIVAIIPNSIVSFITETIKRKTPTHEIVLIVLFFISCLIYLEILELKFWGLNKNITKNIIERGKDEINIDLRMSDASLTSNP